MAIGDSSDITKRLLSVLPPWFPPSDAAPNLNAVLQGPASLSAGMFALKNQAKLQTRILTASDGFLDLIAYEFFGLRLKRQQGQSDNSFRAQILATLLQEKATHKGLISVCRNLLGTTPIVIEPWRPADCGGWNQGTLAYNTAGRYGNMKLRNQVFVIITPTVSGNIPLFGGYNTAREAYTTNSGWNFYASFGDNLSLANEIIYATIAQTMPAGSIAWVNISGKLATSSFLVLSAGVGGGVPVPLPGPLPSPQGSPAPVPTPLPTPNPVPTPVPTPPPTPNPNIATQVDMTSWSPFQGGIITRDPISTVDGFPRYDWTFPSPASRSGGQYGQAFIANQQITLQVEAQGTVPFSFNIWDGSIPNDGQDQSSQIFTPVPNQPTVFSWSVTMPATWSQSGASGFLGGPAILANNIGIPTVTGQNTFDKFKIESGLVATPYIDPVIVTPAPTPIPAPGPGNPTSGSSLGYKLGQWVEQGNLNALQGALGRNFDHVITFVSDDTGFSAGTDYGYYNFNQICTFGLPDLGGAAAGNYDGQIIGRLQAIQGACSSNGKRLLAIRLCHEFNGAWYPWGNQPTNLIAAYRHLVPLIRQQVPGVLINWNLSAPTGDQQDPNSFYPGDAYVDIIGFDMYDNISNNFNDWLNGTYNGQFGMTYWSNFAAARGKGFSLPEIGIGASITDGSLMNSLINWINTHPVVSDFGYSNTNSAVNGDLLVPGTPNYNNYVNAYKGTHYGGSWPFLN